MASKQLHPWTRLLATACFAQYRRAPYAIVVTGQLLPLPFGDSKIQAQPHNYGRGIL